MAGGGFVPLTARKPACAAWQRTAQLRLGTILATNSLRERGYFSTYRQSIEIASCAINASA
jgi:hypothetical protein